MHAARCTVVFAAIAWLGSLPAQELPPVVAWPTDAAPAVAFLQKPAGFDEKQWAPVVVLFASNRDEGATRAAMQTTGAELARRGFVVVAPVLAVGNADWRANFARLRHAVRIEQGGVHALVLGNAEAARAFVLAHRVEFQSITLGGEAASADATKLRQLPSRRVRVLRDDEAPAAAMQAMHAARALPGAAGEVAKVLDDFHDAAAVADGKRYFAILPEDALFLGTDATERWTGAAFRRFAAKYFQGDSAWTYVCLGRKVDVDAGGAFAWFDEAFDNESYGECRGSGVMAKVDGRWVLRQYHLTVPVPNDVTRDVAARIRAFQDKAPLPVTTVVVVRHAEKQAEGQDPALTDAGRARAAALARMLRDVAFDGVYTSEFARTQQTLQPLCEAKALHATSLPAAKTKELAARILGQERGHTVLVCGHSNTVPDLLRALGVTERVTIGDDEYDRVFVVTLTLDGARLAALRY